MFEMRLDFCENLNMGLDLTQDMDDEDYEDEMMAKYEMMETSEKPSLVSLSDT